MPCHDCGRKYGEDEWIEAVIPDRIWAEISPTKEVNPDGGVLCISCMAKRLNKAGYRKVPVWLCGTEPFKTMDGDPNEFLNIMRSFKGDLFHYIKVGGKNFPVLLRPCTDDEGGFWVECPNLPGCASQGDTAKEALEHVKEAIELAMDENEVPKTRNKEE